MKLTFVVEVEPIIPPLESSEEWAYKYYGGIIEQYLERHFDLVMIYSYKGARHER